MKITKSLCFIISVLLAASASLAACSAEQEQPESVLPANADDQTPVSGGDEADAGLYEEPDTGLFAVSEDWDPDKVPFDMDDGEEAGIR